MLFLVLVGIIGGFTIVFCQLCWDIVKSYIMSCLGSF